MKNFLLFIILLIFTKTGAQPPVSSVGDSLSRIGKYAEAVLAYQKTEPKSAAVHLKIARAYRAQGNFGKALVSYEKGSGSENLPLPIFEYGKLLYQVKQFKKADSIFQKLTINFPENPDFHYHHGLVKERLNDSTAIDEFQKTFLLDGTHQKAIYKLAVQRFKQEEFEKVEHLGKTALKSYPENVEILGLLGQNAMVMQNYSVATERFEGLLSLGENSAFVHENLGAAYYRLGELEKSLKHYKSVVDLEPQHVIAYHSLGKIYNLLGKPEKAEASLKKALFLKKMGLSGMYQTLGTTYKLKKDFAKAIDYFKLSLQENPYNWLAQYELALAADQYYEDLQTRLNYYKIFVRKFESFPQAKSFLDFAEYRIAELKKEKFMEKE